MKEVYRHLRQRARQLEQHPLFTEWLDDPARPPERKLIFAPMMIDFTMGFRDFNRHFVTTGEGGDALAQALDVHAAEDATHSALFLEDWVTLGLDERLGWTPSDVFWWMTSDHTLPARRADFELTRLVWRHPDPRLRFAIIETMEIAGQVFFRHTVPVAAALAPRLARPLRYFGPHHLEREDGHLQHADERVFFATPLEPALRTQAVALVDAVVDLFDRHFSSWLALARTIDQRQWTMLGAVEGHRAGLVTRTSLPDDVAGLMLDPTPSAGGAAVSPASEALQAHRRELIARLDDGEPFYGWLRGADFVPAARLTFLQWAVDNWACADWFRLDATYEQPATALERGLNRVSELYASEMRRRHAEWKLLDLDNVTGWDASDALAHYWLDPLIEEMRAAFADLRRLTFEHPEPRFRYWIIKGFVRFNDLIALALGAPLRRSRFEARSFPVYADEGGLLHPDLPADPEADAAVAAVEREALSADDQAIVRSIHERLAAQETRRARASWQAVRRYGLAT